MAVDTTFKSLFDNLKLEDPWLPPRPWESIPSQSGLTHPKPSSPSHSSTHLYDTPIVSEVGLVRLAINALQGIESALVSIEKLCERFDSNPSDRTSHRIPTLWNRSSSTMALGNLIRSIAHSGFIVFLLSQFVEHFTCIDDLDEPCGEKPPYSLVNQAFSVAVRRVLEGYICAVDTLYASVGARRLEKNGGSCFREGGLARTVHCEVTLLEVYLHTRELTCQIEALGSICNVQEIALCFSESSFEGLVARAKLEFKEFPRGGGLLTYLYEQLKVAEPAHNGLLKFLFLKSFEPYCEFIRSWIFKARFCDPYKEFIVEHDETSPSWSSGGAERCSDISLVTIREHVTVPCFLKDFSVPLLRTGQQLQVLMKLLELCTHVDTGNHKYEDILSSWRDFSVGYSYHATPLAFNNEDIEAMILSRNSYYEGMLEKLDITLTKLDIRYQQVTSHANLPIFVNDKGGDQSFFSYSTDKINFDEAINTVDCETSRTSDEFSSVDDFEESSVSSSSSGFEDRDESVHLNKYSSSLVEQQYLTAIDFVRNTPDNASLNCSKRDASNSFYGYLGETPDRADLYNLYVDCCPGEEELRSNPPCRELKEPNRSCFYENQCSDSQPGEGLFLSGPVKNPFLVEEGSRYLSHPLEQESKVNSRNAGIFKEVSPYLRHLVVSENSSQGEVIDRGEFTSRSDSSSLFSFPSLNLKYCPDLLSMNPILSKTDLTSKHVGRYWTDQTGPFPFFDFSSVRDPCKVLVGQSLAIPRQQSGTDIIPKNYHTSVARGMKNCLDNDGNDFKGISITKTDLPGVSSSEPSCEKEEKVIAATVFGGSGWQSMLGCFDYAVSPSVRVQRTSSEATFKIPLDFVIEKCLLQEILLQYRYVSKLTIKLLDEGFDLQEHFLALRRYHFMGFADWADLFITSLWHNKWQGREAAHEVSKIQGLLEKSIQQSSCARDRYKDKLFVYIKEKGAGVMPLSASTIRIDSFDFLALGYRVDWPVSLVLTQGALKIYSEIFTFLIRVKLGVFSLTEVWCSLKDLLPLVSKTSNSEIRVPQMRNFNILMRVRLEVNHFVSTLQHYVQSQLSHVSWCRFLDCLNHKVKDMVDLETLHAAYLTDCLHMCFLSDEMQSVACIIESILQCALDFRSCLGENTAEVGHHGGGFLVDISQINISKVLDIKQTFDNNIKELHLCHLKTPGLSQFLGCLNYNNYYSDGGYRITY